MAGLSRPATIMLVFTLHGMIAGALFPRLAELQKAMGITEAELGTALIGGSAGSFISFWFASRLIERFGTRRVLAVGMPLFAFGPALATLATGTLVFFLIFMLYGTVFNSSNVAINVEADRIEAALRKRIMNRCHGMWSLGFFGASLAGTAAAAIPLSPGLHLGLMTPLLGAVALATVATMDAALPRAHSGGARRRAFAMPSRANLILMGFLLAGIWLESGTRAFSVIYLRDTFATADWIATLTLPFFLFAQIAGRFLSDTLIERFGAVPVTRTQLLVAFCGLLPIVAAVSVPAALIGFALIGFGVSSSHPQALSAAAQIGDRPSSENVAAQSVLSTIVMFVTPPLMGFVATEWDIRMTFAIILPVPVLAVMLAPCLRPGAFARPAAVQPTATQA